MYKRLLAQCITRYNGEWYCHLCNNLLPDKEEAKYHSQEAHFEQISTTNRILEFLDTNKISNKQCNRLIFNGIVLKNLPNDYFCTICQCSIPSFDHINEHVMGKYHQTHKTANTTEKNPTTTQQNSNGEHNSSDETLEYLTKRFNSMCSLYYPIQINTSPDISKYSGIKVHDESQGYFCEICKCLIPTYNSIHNHVNGIYHQMQEKIYMAKENSRDDQTDSDSYTSETQSESISSDILKSNGIKDSDGPQKYFCEICNCPIPTYYHVDDHVNGRNHQANKETYIAEKNSGDDQTYSDSYTSEMQSKSISPDILKSNGIKDYDGPQEYFCEICNCPIPTYYHVDDHVNGRNHQANKEAYIAEKNSGDDQTYSDSYTSETQSESISPDILKCNGIKDYDGPQEYFCEICNCPIPTYYHVDDHVNGRNHQINKEAYIAEKNSRDDQTYSDSYTSEIQDENISPDILKYNGIKTYDGPQEYFCEICNCPIATYYHVDDHVNGRNHQTYKKAYIAEKNSRDDQTYSDSYTSDSVSTSEKASTSGIQTPTSTTNTSTDMSSAAADNNRQNITLPQNKKTMSGLFITPDILKEMNGLLNMYSPRETVKQNRNALERYNKIYETEYFLFENIVFSCRQTMLKKIQENLQFYIPFTNQSVTCLACDASHNSCDVQVWYGHISSVDHAEQLRQLDPKLLKHLIRKQSTHVKCYSCNEIIDEDVNINVHINEPLHQRNRNKLLTQIKSYCNHLLKKIADDPLFYAIQYFACVPCKRRFKVKVEFMEHLYETHKFLMNTKDNRGFGFCITCAILWYGNNKCLYSAHCKNQIHQYLEKSNDLTIKPLTKEVTKLLECIDQNVAAMFKISEDARAKSNTNRVINDLTHTLKSHHPSKVKVHVYGSRYTGLALSNSDIDIYLDFGEPIGRELIKSTSKQIEECLHADYEIWQIEEILYNTRTPIIRLKHISTGMKCDISYMHGLSVENSKFIKLFNMTYLPCRKMILFLKKWMQLCCFITPGSQKISNYALTWLVIFYLQVRHGLPSIISLIKSHKKSKIVSGWQVGVGDSITINAPKLSMHELLLGFFEYYGEFNYIRSVICPLLGKECDKQLFTVLLDKNPTFPEGMEPYRTHLKSPNPEFFRIDSPMCVQDPFVLSFNVTRAVQILVLRDFKHCCKESALKLREIHFADRKNR